MELYIGGYAQGKLTYVKMCIRDRSGEGQEVCGKVKEELAAYYGMEDSGIRVSYVGGT